MMSVNKKCRNRWFISSTIGITTLIAGCGGDSSSSGGRNEGSVNSPVTITVDTPSTRSIGGGGTNYYQFTATSGNVYQISLTNTQSDLSWVLYENSAFTFWLMECDINFNPGAADESCQTASALSANTTYYLTVDEWDNRAGSFTLLIESVASAP
jgi:hypothetical protein